MYRKLLNIPRSIYDHLVTAGKVKYNTSHSFDLTFFVQINYFRYKMIVTI